MSQCRRLLKRPRPYPDESLAGYIIRLSEANHYASPKLIFQVSGLRARGIYANIFYQEKDDLSRLSNLCDVEKNTLWLMAFPGFIFRQAKVVKQAKVFSDVVPTDALNRNRVQLCPICLQEKPYYRSIWELSIVSACPLHHCVLINRCPQCQLPIQWSRPSIVLCSCQFDWRSFQPEVLENEQIALSRHIYKLCALSILPSEGNGSFFSDNPVEQLKLGSLFNLLISLLRFCRQSEMNHQLFLPEKTSLGLSSKSVNDFEEVFSLFKSWPDEFCQFLDRHELNFGYKGSKKNIYRWSFRDVIDFFESVFVCFYEESWEFIREILADYLERFLRQVSIKEVKISFYKDFQFYSVSISLTRKTPLTKKLASRSELQGLTLGKLFALSRIDWYNETLSFRMRYFPE